MDLKPPRGTQDWLPADSERLRAVYEACHLVAGRYGFRYVETPTFEDTELFARSSGETSDVVSKEMYTFADRADRSLTLRPEGTAPVVRAYLANQHAAPHPFKAYYVETLFRYGRPQKGRLREYRSFGVEVLASARSEADVEVIAVGAALLNELSIRDYELQLNSLGDETCRPGYRRLLVEYLVRNRDRIRDEHRDRFEANPMRVLDCKDESCVEVAAGAPVMIDHLCPACREHFDAVTNGVEDEQIPFSLTHTLARGLDYYTRTAFEFVGSGLSRSQGTMIGGGRYDGLAELVGGRPVPGVGFGSGIERLMLAAEAGGARVAPLHRLDCSVVVVRPSEAEAARTILRELRRRGVHAEMAFDHEPVQTQLGRAEGAGARFAVILGAREVESGTLTVKRLSDAEQRELSMDEAVTWMREEAGRP